jgi:hypothetical protein
MYDADKDTFHDSWALSDTFTMFHEFLLWIDDDAINAFPMMTQTKPTNKREFQFSFNLTLIATSMNVQFHGWLKIHGFLLRVKQQWWMWKRNKIVWNSMRKNFWKFSLLDSMERF